VLVELHWPGPDTGEGALFGLMRGFHAWGFRVFHREPNVANVQRCWEFAMAKVFFALLHSCAYSLVCLLFYNIFAVPFASLQTLVGCILAVTNYSCCFKQFDAFTLLLVFVCKVAAVNEAKVAAYQHDCHAASRSLIQREEGRLPSSSTWELVWKQETPGLITRSNGFSHFESVSRFHLFIQHLHSGSRF